mmetsp:Transcript_2700/g.4083  ORF Transcript_2700/g.4083 Transcript_2700/m.4083 type:complete len:706 (+) Transcript_2700:156-2273(+)|eukprot:CAMPEP_0194200632 /NCGR_PEP_ID=MMETSP0156-20130528/1151_1 /TAXON_ID=33649 /ORGANISM="Thalassionema nitzschioides, Strain L26-B" /LENGTH=705 /DNA_ID=CAMNT_0038925649 /DNA_START=103 /DNA_END=2220 /DNA_ORIENTATION=+
MSTNFGSTSYASAFEGLPTPDVDFLRRSALEFLAAFDKQKWYEDPMTSILNGEKLSIIKEDLVETKDAFGNVNGLQQVATAEEVEKIKNFLQSFKSPYSDLRLKMRAIEQELLTTYAGSLIGTQCLDFGKQDGITELEEATMANAVERYLNDLLLKEELDGKIKISRAPIFVSCVSNFTLFLDLFRKTLRSLELGIPCVILGRTNTSQHHYRWAELLLTLMKKHQIADLGMLTFLSCSLEDIKHITQQSRDVAGNLYTTCSRQLAREIMKNYPNTIASTGGPNTLVAANFTSSISEAIRMSSSIESSGQCTALRHCVIPSTITADEIAAIFAGKTKIVSNPADAVKKGIFDGVFQHHKGSNSPPESKYTHLENEDVFFRINKALPDEDINEYWRKVVVDFSQFDATWADNEKDVESVAMWLNREQPITLAVNGPRKTAFVLGKNLFEKTGLVVYTIGSTDDNEMPPGLTCQARPQDGEIFGEFPPRHLMGEYTKFPVVVPSSTPSYGSTYTPEYLNSVELSSSISDTVKNFVMNVENATVRGYCFELLNYLEDSTKINPKRGSGISRTSLWGLQRPPIISGLKTLMRCTSHATFDALAPSLILFVATNANAQYELSIDENCSTIRDICAAQKIPFLLETDDEFRLRAQHEIVYNIIETHNKLTSYPMVGHYISLFMPLGHVKSTKSKDEEFIERFTQSAKWLKLL